ncbi:MAG: hypothetical protein K2N88_08585 [Muribaculaceae bacterium]|nr:hypothetical protein [Muribaculaceae bacterium]
MNTEKVLVAYFVRKGKEDSANSVKLAKKLEALLKAKGVDYNTFAITPTEIYPEDAAEFEAVTKEENHAKARPELVGKYSGMKYVDRMVVIAPNWWESLPTGVLTFFDDYDMTGKRVVPVIATSDDAKKVRLEVRDYLPHTWVLEGVDVKDDGTEADTDAALAKAVEQLFEPDKHSTHY